MNTPSVAHSFMAIGGVFHFAAEHGEMNGTEESK